MPAADSVILSRRHRCHVPHPRFFANFVTPMDLWGISVLRTADKRYDGHKLRMAWFSLHKYGEYCWETKTILYMCSTMIFKCLLCSHPCAWSTECADEPFILFVQNSAKLNTTERQRIELEPQRILYYQEENRSSASSCSGRLHGGREIWSWASLDGMI